MIDYLCPMAYTLEQLETLEAAIASGTRIVRYGDKEVTYQSLDAMRSLRRDMMAELGLLPMTNRKFYARHNKGLDT